MVIIIIVINIKFIWRHSAYTNLIYLKAWSLDGKWDIIIVWLRSVCCYQAGPRGFEMGSMQGWCFLRLIWKVEVITMFVCFIFSMLMFCRCLNLEILRCNVLIVNINNNINTKIKGHLQLWFVNFHSDITVLA